MAYLLSVVAAISACFLLQNLALRAVGGRTAKSESNYFSSLGRIQAGTVGKPEVMMLGSSITGRLPDRAKEFEGFANMGCDGGSAVDALRAMDRGILPQAPVLVIEVNTLGLALDGKATEIGRAMTSPWFRAGMEIPSLSAYARPAAFFYSALLAKRIGGFGEMESGADLEAASVPSENIRVMETVLSPPEEALVGEIVPIIARLRENGSRIVFVWLPPGRVDESPVPPWIAELVSRSQAEWWDLGQDADPSLVTLTDGIHMSAPSAARTVNSLRGGLGL